MTDSKLPPAGETFMLQALLLAEQSVAAGGGPFGAVVVKAGAVVASGANRVVLDHDPTAHAEIVALRAAARALGDHVLAGCEVYSSCEPCPMCLGALWWARVDRVFFSASRDDAAAAGFDDAALYREVGSPLAARRLPIAVLLPDRAHGPFAAWRTFAARNPY